MNKQQQIRSALETWELTLIIMNLQLNGARGTRQEIAEWAGIIMDVAHPKSHWLVRLFYSLTAPFRPVRWYIQRIDDVLDLGKVSVRLGKAMQNAGYNLAEHPWVLRAYQQMYMVNRPTSDFVRDLSVVMNEANSQLLGTVRAHHQALEARLMKKYQEALVIIEDQPDMSNLDAMLKALSKK